MREVWNDIQGANYFWMIAALVAAIASHIFRSLRWNLLINSLNYKTKLSTTFYALMVGYMANTAVPRMGEFMRCGVLSRKEKIPFNALFGTVISERIFDLIVLIVIIFLVLLFQMKKLSGFLEQTFGPFFQNVFSNINSLLLFIGISIVTIALLIFIVIKLKEKIKKLPFYQKAHGFLDGLFDGIKTIMKLKEKWLFLFHTIIIWAFYALMVYFPMFMLPETSNLDFADALTILAIGSLGVVAPVPGGIGAYHFIVKAVLVEIFGIGGNAAGSFAAITHAGQTILNVFVGSLSYFYLGILSKRENPLNE
jgi:glycosyltransferase 2 family protein